MDWQLPPISDAWKAIELYLRHAYLGDPPHAVQGRVGALRAASAADFYRVPIFECLPAGEPTRYSLRLGNRFYPHMKLVIERAPDGAHALFRADTHDRHVQPASGSPEASAFAELALRNQEIAQLIEAAWEENGLATFKQYLRDDLARRQAARQA